VNDSRLLNSRSHDDALAPHAFGFLSGRDRLGRGDLPVVLGLDRGCCAGLGCRLANVAWRRGPQGGFLGGTGGNAALAVGAARRAAAAGVLAGAAGTGPVRCGLRAGRGGPDDVRLLVPQRQPDRLRDGNRPPTLAILRRRTAAVCSGGHGRQSVLRVGRRLLVLLGCGERNAALEASGRPVGSQGAGQRPPDLGLAGPRRSGRRRWPRVPGRRRVAVRGHLRVGSGRGNGASGVAERRLRLAVPGTSARRNGLRRPVAARLPVDPRRGIGRAQQPCVSSLVRSANR
jgi:hypothetical protein